MEQYIKKSAIVAEIESKRKYAQHLGDNAINSSMQQFYDGMKQSCVDILSFINTLEVKEMKNFIWNNARTTIPEDSTNQIICIKEDGLAVSTIGKIVNDTVKWAYLDDLLNTNSFNVEVKEVENTELLKVRGYLVRDKDDYTAIYAEKPHRGKTEWVDNSCLMTINDARLVPDLEFEDEPVEVEVTLKRV